VNLRGHKVFAGGSTITTPYIHNAVSGIPVAPIPVSAFRTESLGELALRMRRAITKYHSDLDGIVADLRWRCANPLKVVFPCPPGGEFGLQTNWRAARFGDLDFSGACVAEKASARVVFVLGLPTSGNNVPMRGSGAVLMEDEDAVWMSEVRGAKDWATIRQSGNAVFI
jgi:hypothetical protein